MRVLIMCYHDPAENKIASVRVRKLAEHLERLGVEIKVLSRERSTSTGEIYTGAVRLEPERRGMPGVGETSRRAVSGRIFWRTVRKLRTVSGWGFRLFVAIPDREVFTLPKMRRTARQLGNWRPDIIFCSGPPFSVFVLGRALSRKYGVPWIADYRDLWTTNAYYSHPTARRHLDRLIEKRLLSSAACATATSLLSTQNLREAFGVAADTVMNGYDPEDLDKISPQRPLPGLPLRIVYTGEIYEGKRRPDILLEACSKMHLGPDQIRISFYGNTVASLRNSAVEHAVEDMVSFEGRLPYLKSLEAQKAADVLLLLMWDDPGERGTVPGKLFEYIGARRPILLIGPREAEAADLLQARGAGFVASTVEEVCEALGGWLEVKRARRGIEDVSQDRAAGLTRADQAVRLKAILDAVLEGETQQ